MPKYPLPHSAASPSPSTLSPPHRRLPLQFVSRIATILDSEGDDGKVPNGYDDSLESAARAAWSRCDCECHTGTVVNWQVERVEPSAEDERVNFVHLWWGEEDNNGCGGAVTCTVVVARTNDGRFAEFGVAPK